MADRPTCLHQGWELVDHQWVKGDPCGRPATQVVQGPHGQKPWHGCGRHAPDMAKALSIGQSGDFSATTKRVKA
jgi:hypothetical protein